MQTRPRPRRDWRSPDTVRVEVWDVATKKMRYAIDCPTDVRALFVEDPPRLVLAPRVRRQSATWLAERVQVLDAETGARIGTLDLSPE